jgi:NADPH:quinone reductase-like Zn-dependent oxidoreductase
VGASVKAVYFQEHGDLDRLEFGDLPTPSPGPGEVLVRLRWAALNRSDLFTLQGWPGLDLEKPHILGGDGAGQVSSWGAGVEGFAQGDWVVVNANLSDGTCERCLAGMDNLCLDWHLLGETRRGTFAEYVVVPGANLRRIPEGFDARTAAAAGLVYLTAWHSLVTRGELRAGETVLVVGASGGVNSACIDIAKMLGARVFAVGSSPEKLAGAEALGADVLIDRSKEENWSKAAYLASDKRGVDVVVDNVGAPTLAMSIRTARKGGRILTVGNTAGSTFEFDNRFMFYKQLSFLGSTMGNRSDFATVMGLVFEGRLRPRLDRDYPLQDAAVALGRMRQGEHLGKITLSIE